MSSSFLAMLSEYQLVANEPNKKAQNAKIKMPTTTKATRFMVKAKTKLILPFDNPYLVRMNEIERICESMKPNPLNDSRSKGQCGLLDDLFPNSFGKR